MKRVLLLLSIIASVVGFSQSISINTTSYTTEELINDVLINSPCISGKNFNSKTGNSFGSTESIAPTGPTPSGIGGNTLGPTAVLTPPGATTYIENTIPRYGLLKEMEDGSHLILTL